MKNFKKFEKTKIILICILISISYSCNILDEDPLSLIVSDIHYSTEQGINQGLNAAYSFLREFYGKENGFSLTVPGTDIFTSGNGGTKGDRWQFNNYNKNFLGDENFITNTWDNFYRGINQCNTVINRTPELKSLQENEKNKIIAEASFLRALYYFHLVQQFGEVHFSLDETIGVETEANRTSINVIYNNGIIPDLEFAISNLPVLQSDYGRVTKPAAEALLARVYLTIGNWTKAYQLSKNVIDNYNFSLVTPYSELWKIENDVNDEIIWSVQYTSDPLTNNDGNHSHVFFVCQYYQNPAMVRDIENGRPYQRFMPTNFLLNLWDSESDYRWDYSFKTIWFANTTATINGFSIIPGDTAIKMVLYPVEDAIKKISPYWYIDYRNEEVTTQKDNFQIGGFDRLIFPTLWKFYDNLRPSVNDLDGRRDFPVIRLAEMYLIASEASHKLGNNDEAANLINILRKRVVKPGKEKEMHVETNDINLDFILDERARELCGEMHRWYDLKRTGLLVERVKKYNLDAASNISEMHLVRPIPRTQIDRVSNPNEFFQNPGY